MSRIPPRVVARGAAYGGGGLGTLGTLGALGYALLKLEARLARRAVPPLTAAPMADGHYGDPHGVAVQLIMLGDSGAAGFGAEFPAETPGAVLAADLAAAGRYVTLETLAFTGARCADLDLQVTLTLADRVWDSPEPATTTIVVINIGANDVTHWNPPKRAVAHLVAAVTRLRSAGVRVVVGTCPDLGALALLPQPLRAFAGVKSAQMAAAQSIGVVSAGGVPVALGSQLGKQFSGQPGMVCFDRFHPSGKGYRAIAGALLPAVRTAAGLAPPAPDPANAAADPANPAADRHADPDADPAAQPAARPVG